LIGKSKVTGTLFVPEEKKGRQNQSLHAVNPAIKTAGIS
jgi:hypothetical protein